MHLIPNHALETEMAAATGVRSAQDLFGDIPQALRAKALRLPPAEPERHMVRRLRTLLARNQSYDRLANFLGGGNKPQLVPAAVKAVAHRQEFITSYTPYQPEVSQGLLQVIFEYQSLMCDITRMEVSNAGMYDFPTALGEAALMATRANGRLRFLVPEHMSWEKRSILRNYTVGPGIAVDTYRYDDKTGRADLASLAAKLGPDVSGVYLENPNHFGVFEEDARKVGEMAKAAGALFVMGVDLTALGVATPPGLLGADVVVAEGSCFGGAPALGGPLLGTFLATEELVRKMPGRIIGATKDEAGKRGFVMTLQAREQHIRRSKATSNICSNEALIANQAAIHLTMLGRTGLRTMGLQNLEAGAKLESALAGAGLHKRFTGATYNELVTRVQDPAGLHERALQGGVHAGWDLGRDLPSLKGCLLWGSTPVHNDEDYQRLGQVLLPAIKGVRV
ncbi:MAG: glycine dehydrogenase subunit 1 [Thermoplasmata archaeon]|nr:glycine dehydrogenase subunit 1 [Thermoplasmata archaeon]